MLDSLTFLLERLFLLAHIRVSSLLDRDPGAPGEPPLEPKPTTRRPERTNPTPQPRHQDRDQDRDRPSHIHTQRFQRGDLLEVPRTLFTHFGIFLGGDRVAHLIPDALPAVTGDLGRIRRTVTNTRLLLGVLSKRASVRVDSVEDFAYGAPVLLNAMDRAVRTEPLGAEEVALRAERLLGAVPYSLLWNNCEHYVTYCRYGTATSLQTDRLCERFKSLVRDQRSVFLSLLLGVLSMGCLGVSAGTALPALLVPFTLWMAS